MHKDQFIRDFLDKRKDHDLLRKLKRFDEISSVKVRIDGKPYLNFSSNDYLGLSHSQVLTDASRKALEKDGAGSTASRLVSGNNHLYATLEQALSKWKGTESALVFNSGYQANSTVIPAIADRKTAIFSDRLNHASIIDGILLSRAEHLRFRHNDMNQLEKLLQKSPAERKIIISETLFSMDGDLADFSKLKNLKNKYDAFLYLDDAHGSGIFGPGGRGPAWEIMDSVDFYIGTFGKALGSFGAYCACTSEIKEFLVNSARGLIYSTALPPAVLGANIAAVEEVQKMDSEREYLNSLTEKFRNYIASSSFDTIESGSPVIPLITGDQRATLAMSQFLLEAGIFAVAIRPPTVPEGAGRIRFTLSSSHTDEHLNRLVSTLKSWK